MNMFGLRAVGLASAEGIAGSRTVGTNAVSDGITSEVTGNASFPDNLIRNCGANCKTRRNSLRVQFASQLECRERIGVQFRWVPRMRYGWVSFPILTAY